MTAFEAACVGTFLAAVAVGMLIPSWLDRRRATRRLAAAESAFWVSLRAFVEEAREDIEAPETETPIFDALAIERLRADLDSWGQA